MTTAINVLGNTTELVADYAARAHASPRALYTAAAAGQANAMAAASLASSAAAAAYVPYSNGTAVAANFLNSPAGLEIELRFFPKNIFVHVFIFVVLSNRFFTILESICIANVAQTGSILMDGDGSNVGRKKKSVKRRKINLNE